MNTIVRFQPWDRPLSPCIVCFDTKIVCFDPNIVRFDKRSSSFARIVCFDPWIVCFRPGSSALNLFRIVCFDPERSSALNLFGIVCFRPCSFPKIFTQSTPKKLNFLKSGKNIWYQFIFLGRQSLALQQRAMLRRIYNNFHRRNPTSIIFVLLVSDYTLPWYSKKALPGRLAQLGFGSRINWSRVWISDQFNKFLNPNKYHFSPYWFF